MILVHNSVFFLLRSACPRLLPRPPLLVRAALQLAAAVLLPFGRPAPPTLPP